MAKTLQLGQWIGGKERVVQVTVEVPVTGSASNGEMLDHVTDLLTNSLQAAEARFSLTHSSVLADGHH